MKNPLGNMANIMKQAQAMQEGVPPGKDLKVDDDDD